MHILMRGVERFSVLDVLDKNILQEMSKGVSSYDNLAKKSNVNRSRVYRRVRTLERRNIILRQTRVLVNFAKLNLVTVLMGANVSNADAEKIISVLSEKSCVKMLWQSFGVHNLVAIMFCEKGDEGNEILEMRKIFEQFKAGSFDASVGFRWRKMETTPF